MTHSMTAFSRLQANCDLGELTWEIRSVNHRFLEISFRLPEPFRSAESAARNLIGKQVKRGKIDCSLKFQPSSKSLNPNNLDEVFTGNLLQTLQRIEQLAEDYPLRPPTTLDLLAWPGVVADQQPGDMELVQKQLLDSLSTAITELSQARKTEGEKLEQLILSRIEEIDGLIKSIETALPKVLHNQRNRLEDKLAEISQSINADRLEQEMVLAATKLDIDEELDRLKIHVNEVRLILQRKEPIGRRLDFMMQELNREVNTIASKSVDGSITKATVDLKVLVEQMREQVQNIE